MKIYTPTVTLLNYNIILFSQGKCENWLRKEVFKLPKCGIYHFYGFCAPCPTPTGVINKQGKICYPIIFLTVN